MNDTQTLPDIESMSFEHALKELEGIVGKLEQGSVDLEQSIQIYERGETLKKHCEKLLSQAEKKIEKIRLSSDGTPQGVDSVD